MDKNYTVCCIGFQPEIAQFNGLKTLGGYKSTYPHNKCLEVRAILNNDQKICASRLQIHQSDIEGVNFNQKNFLNNKNMKGFSEGGRPPVGKPSIVGEKGAEIFVPDVSGTVISNKNINLSLPSMSKMRTVIQPIIQKDTQVVTKTIVKKQMQPVPIFISSNRKISKLASMIS